MWHRHQSEKYPDYVVEFAHEIRRVGQNFADRENEYEAAKCLTLAEQLLDAQATFRRGEFAATTDPQMLIRATMQATSDDWFARCNIGDLNGRRSRIYKALMAVGARLEKLKMKSERLPLNRT